MTKPTPEFLEAFGDPGLARVIDEIHAAREELHEANEAAEEIEVMDEDQRLDDPRHGQAHYINRKYD